MCGVLEWWNVTLPLDRADDRLARRITVSRSLAMLRRRWFRTSPVAAVDEMHAAIGGIDIGAGSAGHPCCADCGPNSLRLMPIGGTLLPGGLPNWSYQKSSSSPIRTAEFHQPFCRRHRSASFHPKDGRTTQCGRNVPRVFLFVPGSRKRACPCRSGSVQ